MLICPECDKIHSYVGDLVRCMQGHGPGEKDDLEDVVHRLLNVGLLTQDEAKEYLRVAAERYNQQQKRTI